MTPDPVISRIYSFGIGVEVFSITDHNSSSNTAAFKAAAAKKGLIFIPGIELQTIEEIHLLGYFPNSRALDQFYSKVVEPGHPQGFKNDPSRFGNQLKMDGSGNVIGEEEAMLSMALSRSIDELVELIHKHAGVAVAAHIDRGFSVISHLGYLPPDLELDAVEVKDIGKVGELKARYMKERELNIISSSDSHYLDLIPKPKMKLWVERPDVAGCLDCIKGEGPGRITLREPARRAAKDRSRF